MGEKIQIGDITIDKGTRYWDAFERFPDDSSAWTIRQLVYRGYIEKHQKETYSSQLQTLIDKGLIKHQGSSVEYGLTKKGEALKRRID